MIAEWLRRLRYWLAAGRRRDELEEEMRLHVQLRAERLAAGGMDGTEAERAARRRFGNRTQLHEESRERWLGRRLDDLGRDLRTGWRGLRRNPAFTMVVVATLGLGIGTNGAIFRLYDVLRLRQLPVDRPEELSLIQLADKTGWRGYQVLPWPALTNPQWEYLRDHQTLFDGVLAWSPNTFRLGVDPRPVKGLFVSGGFFGVLGVRPALGRMFRPEEDRRGCGVPGAVLEHGFWEREFAGDPGALGRTIIINGVSVTVVGVAEASFTGLEIGNRFDVAVPICSQAALWNARNWLDDVAVWWLTVMGRDRQVRPQTLLDDRLRALSPELFAATLTAGYPRENAADYLQMRLAATPAAGGVSALRDRYSDSLTLLLGATGLVLLLMSANLGNMVLARSSARRHEFGLRLSIGSSRSALVRQLAVENAILALAGALVGFLVADLLSGSLVGLLGTADGAPFLNLGPTLAGLAYSVGIAAACGLVFGLLPAWRVSRAEPGDALRGNARVTDAGSGATLRKLLVVTQVAVSLVLVFGALLFARTLANVSSAEVGFRRTDLVTSWIDYSGADVAPDRRRDFQGELLDALRTTPGVEAAAETNMIPLSGSGGSSAVRLEGKTVGEPVDANAQNVSARYFETMRIQILAGRDFDARDLPGSPRVVIVNQRLVERLGLGPNPLGQLIRREASPWQPETTFEIVAVVPDTKYWNVKSDFEPIAFYAIAQDPARGLFPFVQHVVRARSDDARLAAALEVSFKARFPNVRVGFRPLDTMVRDGLMRERLLATVSGFLGGLAALIAAIGLYGVIAYLVSRRTNEIGIRKALGATNGHIVRAVTSQAMTLVLVGVGIGAVGALLAGRATRALLFGLAPWDIPTLLAAGTFLVAVAVAAAFLPARRATRLDPLQALRRE